MSVRELAVRAPIAIDIESDLGPPRRTALSLDEIEQLLAGLPRIPSNATISANLSVVRWLAEPRQIINILERLLADPSSISRIAARSYHHVNHFDKLVLVDSECPSDYRLTLHLWDPPYSEQELNEELIHDHRFSFWSHILCGNLVSENYSVATNGNVYRQYQYIPEERDALNFYRFMGEACLATSGIVRRNAGESYFLSHDRIHRVWLPRKDLVCTLVLRGPRASNHSNVYNTVYPNQNFGLTPIMFSAQQLRVKLACLVDKLASGT